VYDNANGAGNPADVKGQATTISSYANNHAYVVQQNGFTAFGESKGETFTFDSTAPGAGLGTPSASGTTTSLTFSNQYEAIDGELTKQSFPAAGGLPSETVTYSATTDLDLPGSVVGNIQYAASTAYTPLSQPQTVTLGLNSNEATVNDGYDPRTGALTDQLVKKSGGTALDEVSYGYSPAGALTSETDTHNGTAATSELQCFAYTTNGQLAQAWTAASSCSTVPTKSSHSTVGDGLGATSEYDEIWAYTALDQPQTEDALVPSANAYATTTYGYSKSTELTSTSTAGAATGSASYTYNADGQQQTRSPNGGQTLGWDGQGDLTGVTKTTGGATVAGYVYDADGNLFTQTEGTKTTVYLPGEQLTIDTSTSPSTLSGTRFYALPGGTIAVRTSATAYGFEIQSDQHGTETLYLDSTAQVPSWRQFDPYGNSRGSAPTSGFPGSRGFLNAPVDIGTGLTNIGARWYDPATGLFVSLDPVLLSSNPLQLNGYTYAGANPVDATDPTGLMPVSDTCNGSACYNPYSHTVGTVHPYSGPPTTAFVKLGPGAAFGPPAILKKNLAKTIVWFNHNPQFGLHGVCGPVDTPCSAFDQEADCMENFENCAIGSDAFLVDLFFQHLCSLGGLDYCSAKYDVHYLSLLPKPAGMHDTGDGPVDGGGGEEGGGEEGGGRGVGVHGGADAEVDPGYESEGLLCGSSFAAGTGVLLASGKAVPISSLKPGDKVLATNTKTGKTSPEAVTVVEVNHDTDLYDLSVKSSHGVAVLHTTASHLFWDPSQGKWVKAADLKHDEPLKTASGQAVIADGGTIPATRDGWMWDLTIPGNGDHDFYVVGYAARQGSYRPGLAGRASANEIAILVHNCQTFRPFGISSSPTHPGVYEIRFKNGKIYIGSSATDVHSRLHAAFNDSDSAVRAAGLTKADVSGVYVEDLTGWSWEDIQGLEQEYIDLYGGIGGGTLINRRNEVP
jgi:RHS repeat-associated protein